MKTTIDLPDDLAARAKSFSREHNVTLRDLVVAGLETELQRRSEPRQKEPFRLKTFGTGWLKPGVTPDQFRELGNERGE